MRRRERRKLKHDIRAAHTTALTNELGSEQAAALRRRASELRAAHGLCDHADDERAYATQQERSEDKRPAVICDLADCGKPRLRVNVFIDAPAHRVRSLKDKAELVAIDLLK